MPSDACAQANLAMKQLASSFGIHTINSPRTSGQERQQTPRDAPHHFTMIMYMALALNAANGAKGPLAPLKGLPRLTTPDAYLFEYTL
jgi:hypothetical protein